MQHFTLPHGPFTFPSFNISISHLLIPSNLDNPIQHYFEVYVQEVLYDLDTDTLKVGVIGLSQGALNRKHSFWDWTTYNTAFGLVAGELELTSSLNPNAQPVPISWSGPVGSGGYWYHFPLHWEGKGSAPLPSFTIDLRHKGMLSSSSRCPDGQQGAWCRPSRGGEVGEGGYLKVAVCYRQYRRVTVSLCSNALYNGDLQPHIRSWLTYHAVLGVQRFIIYDQGYYRATLQPFIDAGLVDYRFWPLPNRDYHLDGVGKADFSQLSCLMVCAPLASLTSEYVATFDIDEWLTPPETDVGEEALQRAQPSHPLLHQLLSSPIKPADCLVFSPNPLTVDPDVALDASAYSASADPLRRCGSFLMTFLALQRRVVIEAKQTLLRSLHAQLIAYPTSLTDQFYQLSHAYQQLHSTNSDPVDFPLFVYNFVDTPEEAEARAAEEVGLNATRTARGVVHWPLAAPQRFHRRLIRHRDDNKQIYRTPMPADLWIHPRNKVEKHVNPNSLRLSHYGSIIRSRWTNKASNVALQSSTHNTVVGVGKLYQYGC